MTDRRGTWRPDHVTPKAWAALVRRHPGYAVAEWFEAHKGLSPETEGENRGPWLRSVLRGGDGLPWCADAVMSAIDAVGAPRLPAFKAGAHRYWHNRSVKNMELATKRGGLWFGHSIMPRRGDLIFWDRRGRRHVDVVMHADATNRKLVCLGGNVADRVAETVVRLGNPTITGFARIGRPTRLL